jgi:hypothetical protein
MWPWSASQSAPPVPPPLGSAAAVPALRPRPSATVATTAAVPRPAWWTASWPSPKPMTH